MGLDVTVHTRVEPFTESVPLDDQGRPDVDWMDEHDVREAFVYAGFEQSYRGLPNGHAYTSGKTPCYGGGYVRSVGATWHFHGGSYSGYNVWRAALCQTMLGVEVAAIWADPDPYRDAPFFELINFADNEGYIGCEAAADLAADFAEYRDRAAATDPGVWQWFERYDTWERAFADAANGGMVEFR